jgi:hypothetical protein
MTTGAPPGSPYEPPPPADTDDQPAGYRLEILEGREWRSATVWAPTLAAAKTRLELIYGAGRVRLPRVLEAQAPRPNRRRNPRK